MNTYLIFTFASTNVSFLVPLQGEKIVDQKRQTIEEIGEQSDVETKNQNLPSILGPGPTELRFQQPIDNEQDLNDCRQNERSLD
jgi:hypothetical protein